MISPDAWSPLGGLELEVAALDVVRSTTSRLVIAGPGAGKTELLAQRACFLLQTGLCGDPQRILALSFKKDAAANLRDRVLKRAGNKLASRFDSVTFDSFAKSILDRFGKLLPEDLRPSSAYRIDNITDKAFAAELLGLAGRDRLLTPSSLSEIAPKHFRNSMFEGPIASWRKAHNITAQTTAAALLWHKCLRGSAESVVTFPMIRRLTAYLFSKSEAVRRLVKATYPFVFLDEFQDTTDHQYEGLHEAFGGSSTCITAVGDHKQRIMVWAGAQQNVFEVFATTFWAIEVRLLRNYRCAPNIIRLIDHLACKMDQKSSPAAPMRTIPGDGEVQLHVFTSDDAEATILADMIHNWISNGTPPTEIAVLTREKAAEYTVPLASALSQLGIGCRDDAKTQEFLSGPLSLIMVQLIILAQGRKSPDEWLSLISLLEQAFPADSDSVSESRMRQGIELVRSLTLDVAITADQVQQIYIAVVDWMGESFFRGTYSEYSKDGELDREIENGARWLSEIGASRDWTGLVDYLFGSGCVRFMTIHKSKGLEFERVIFLGLEDSALWGFAGNKAEEFCTFFVALSRAKDGVYFTHSRTRTAGPKSWNQGQQSVQNIWPLIECLRAVQIQEINH